MTREELIESLPSDLRPWAEIWLPVVLRWGQDKLTEFIASAAGMPWDAAYSRLVETMTTDEKVAELKIRKETLTHLNQDNARFIVDQRTLFFSLLARAVLSLNA